MAQVLLDQAARNDLIEIWQYIARDNDRAADAMLDRIHRGCEVIAQFPYGGTARPELRTDPMTGGVEVARVLHGARDVDTIFRGSR